VAQAYDAPGAHRDHQHDDDGGANDGPLEGDEFLREIHEGVCAGECAEDEEEHPAVEFDEEVSVGVEAYDQAEDYDGKRA